MNAKKVNPKSASYHNSKEYDRITRRISRGRESISYPLREIITREREGKTYPLKDTLAKVREKLKAKRNLSNTQRV